ERPASPRRELRQRLFAGDRLLDAKRAEIAFARERVLQELVILAPRHLDRPEGAQVIGDELGVEQFESTGLQARHQVHQRHLGGVAGAVEHALAKEGAAERDPIKAADQFLALVGLNAVAMPALVELAIEVADAL